MECSNCRKEILKDDIYFKCLDNYLQVNYFDSEEENIFCSKDCFCESLSLKEENNRDDELNRIKKIIENLGWLDE